MLVTVRNHYNSLMTIKKIHKTPHSHAQTHRRTQTHMVTTRTHTDTSHVCTDTQKHVRTHTRRHTQNQEKSCVRLHPRLLYFTPSRIVPSTAESSLSSREGGGVSPTAEAPSLRSTLGYPKRRPHSSGQRGDSSHKFNKSLEETRIDNLIQNKTKRETSPFTNIYDPVEGFVIFRVGSRRLHGSYQI